MEQDPGKSSLRKPFITTANALANLYKTAAAAEKEARDAGARAAYMHVLQWAARKSRRSEALSSADVISMCGSELAKLPHPSPARDDESHSPSVVVGVGSAAAAAPPPPRPPAAAPVEGRRASAHRTVSPDAGAMRDDPLVSDIRKMGLNPRKRPRIAISETFIRACEDSGNAMFSMGSQAGGMRGDFGDGAARGAREADELEGREARAQTGGARGAEARKTRSGRLSFIEKQRRK